jgi:hypothetical protein
MPPLPKRVRCRVLSPEEADRFEPFIDFYCGKDKLEKHEVNRTVRRMWAKRAMPQHAVIVERTIGQDVNGGPPLTGVAGFAIGSLEGVPGVPTGTNGAYIYAIGVDVDYQKRKIARNWRYGNALAQAALEAILAEFGGEAMPYVLAKVKRDNGGVRNCSMNTGSTTWGGPGELVLLRDPEIGGPQFRRRPGWSVA